MNSNGNETVSSVSYQASALSLVGSTEQALDQGRSEILSLVAQDSVAHDCVISLGSRFLGGANAGMNTFADSIWSMPENSFISAIGTHLMLVVL